MITKEQLMNAASKDFRWYGQYLLFKGHIIIEILRQVDKIGLPGKYIPLFTQHSFMPVNLHHGITIDLFEMVKKSSKDYLLSRLKEEKSRCQK